MSGVINGGERGVRPLLPPEPGHQNKAPVFAPKASCKKKKGEKGRGKRVVPAAFPCSEPPGLGFFWGGLGLGLFFFFSVIFSSFNPNKGARPGGVNGRENRSAQPGRSRQRDFHGFPWISMDFRGFPALFAQPTKTPAGRRRRGRVRGQNKTLGAAGEIFLLKHPNPAGFAPR